MIKKDVISICNILADKMSKSGKVAVQQIVAAIEDMEEEPCDDCISRKRLLSRIDAERKHLLDIKMDGAEHIIVHHARRIIEDMPSVTPQHTRWIPVSERLPEETTRVLIYTDTMGIKFGFLSNNHWHVSGYKYVLYDGVLAWMPLPQPYNAESEVNADAEL